MAGERPREASLEERLPEPRPGPSYQREEEDRLAKVGVRLVVLDGLRHQGLFPALDQQLGAAHLLQVPEAPDQDLPDGGQRLCRGPVGAVLAVTVPGEHAGL